MEKQCVKVSIRNLVEFIKRSGDIVEGGSGIDVEAMQKGSRLHRKIQGEKGALYKAEVSLKHVTEYEDMDILVEGRADGIFSEDDFVWIDEIKGIKSKVEKLEKPVEVHKAQAMCYAYIYGSDRQLDHIGVQMTYAELDTGIRRQFREKFLMDDLERWYEELLMEYHKWVSWRQKWIRERNLSIEHLEFPFEYREGQKKIVGSVYHTIKNERQIFVQAPTGVGKTMSAIFPAVRALGENCGEVIFYMTAKTITRTVAENAYEILRKSGLRFKSVILTAKEKLCLSEEKKCSPETCPYAKGHFDRVNDAVFALLQQDTTYDRETILEWAVAHRVCPFEMMLDTAVWVDGVTCDYNHVFDPSASLKRFFGEGNSGRRYIFLIDEAHNLVERSREMYSAVIRRSDVLALRRQTKEAYPKLYKALGRLNKSLLALEKETDNYQVLPDPGVFPLVLLKVQGEIEALLEENRVSDSLLEFYFDVLGFLNIADLFDENYVAYVEKEVDKRGCFVKLLCINPAKNLSQVLAKSAGTVFFSATLLPMGYYKGLLSVREDDYGLYIESPFPKENRTILIGHDTSSKYDRRGYGEYRRIAKYITETAWRYPGNYMVFFPSYAFMEAVREIYEAEFSAEWVRVIIQTPEMHEAQKEDFLDEFGKEHTGSLIGFCIMGGIFSEGIDLTGERLIGAIVVGCGLPQITNERKILMDYYDAMGQDGFSYAYRYPGMNKVLQAAGRVIRTAEDRGVILLLDYRFRHSDYARLFPKEWDDIQYTNVGEITEKLGRFWEQDLTQKAD